MIHWALDLVCWKRPIRHRPTPAFIKLCFLKKRPWAALADLWGADSSIPGRRPANFAFQAFFILWGGRKSACKLDFSLLISSYFQIYYYKKSIYPKDQVSDRTWKIIGVDPMQNSYSPGLFLALCFWNWQKLPKEPLQRHIPRDTLHDLCGQQDLSLTCEPESQRSPYPWS